MHEVSSLLEEMQRQGTYDSSGRFTLDLRVALSSMSRHQLAEPHEYILRVFAAAIARGATRFELKTRAGVVQCDWDGQPFSPRELRELMPSLVSSEPERLAQRELAMGLNSARRLFREMELTSGGHRLRLSRNDLVLEPAGDSPWTSLWLKRPPSLGALIHRLLGRRSREQVLLRQRTALAPLAQTPPLARSPILAVQVGQPPLELDADCVQLPARPEGSGYLLFEPGRPPELTVVHCGVSFPSRVSWGGPLQVLWWTDSLQLDLSRSSLVQPGWFSWAPQALADAAVPLFAETHDLPRLAPLLAFLVSRGIKSLNALPLFRRADQQAVSLDELQRQLHQEGWLGRVREPWTAPGGGWNPSHFVLATESARLVLWTAFDNWVQVDHLQKAPPLRLPAGQEYLVRMPLEDCAGEVGLPSVAPEGTSLVYRGDRAESHRGSPAGLELQLAVDGPEDDWPIPMVELYRALLREDVPQDLKSAHLLEFLCWARADLAVPEGGWKPNKGRSPLWSLCQPQTARELQPDLSPGWLRRLVAEVRLATNRDGPVPLLELRKNRKQLFYCPPGERVGDDLTVLRITELQARRLESLLMRSVRPALPWTEQLAKLVECARHDGPISTLDLLRAMLSFPECAAGQVLHELVDVQQLARMLEDVPESIGRWRYYTSHARALWSRARQEAGARRRLSTEALLLAMLQVDCRAGFLLRELQVDQTVLTHQVASVIGLESPADRSLLTPRQALDQVTQTAYFMLDSGRFEQAEAQLSRAAELAPEDARLRGMAAQGMFLAGQAELALSMFQRALSMGPDPEAEAWLHSHIAEVLLTLERPREAREACEDALRLDAFQPHANALKARLLTDPLEAVRQCQRALRLQGCPASCWETQGLRLVELNLPEDARHCFQQFLTRARQERLMELDVEKRLERAEAMLDKLS